MQPTRTIPLEFIDLIPEFDGDERLLNLFIRKSEYVIKTFRSECVDTAQDIYVFHIVTSRLRGKAAHLISERQDITTWNELKLLLSKHFGDPRSEECIAIELENLKISHGESYVFFCHRIQTVKSALLAKINLIEDEALKEAKMTIYNNMALHVFLYNLPEDMFRVVRHNRCNVLEDALNKVMQEVSFLKYYNKNRQFLSQQYSTQLKPTQSNPLVTKFKSAFLPNNFDPNLNTAILKNKFDPNFNTAILTNKIDPKFTTQNQEFRFGNQTQGFTPQNQSFQFGIPQAQEFGPSVLNKSEFKFGINPVVPTNNQFRFDISPNQNQRNTHVYDNDVSMRTAPPKNGFVAPRTNNLFYPNVLTDYPEVAENYYYDTDLDLYKKPLHTVHVKPQSEVKIPVDLCNSAAITNQIDLGKVDRALAATVNCEIGYAPTVLQNNSVEAKINKPFDMTKQKIKNEKLNSNENVLSRIMITALGKGDIIESQSPAANVGDSVNDDLDRHIQDLTNVLLPQKGPEEIVHSIGDVRHSETLSHASETTRRAERPKYPYKYFTNKMGNRKGNIQNDRGETKFDLRDDENIFIEGRERSGKDKPRFEKANVKGKIDKNFKDVRRPPKIRPAADPSSIDPGSSAPAA